MEWSVFHNYQSLVRAELAKPIECPNCDWPVITLRGENDEPKFWCPSCDSSYFIGLRTYNDIKDAVTRQIGE